MLGASAAEIQHETGHRMGASAFDLLPTGFRNNSILPYEVEDFLPPSVRRSIRLTRIAAYEGTRWECHIPGERFCLEFDV